MSCHVSLDRPWLQVSFDRPQRVLSWALNQPGFVETDTVLWREVRNSDLPRDLDVLRWLQADLTTRHAANAVAFLTSRDLNAYRDVSAVCEDVTVRCIATVGLSNAERVGERVDRSAKDWGTINILVAATTALTDAARIEAMSIATQARTVAVMNAGLQLASGPATGTGTDCIAIAAPAGHQNYSGLHTALGEAIGRAVLEAVEGGAAEWMDTVRRKESP